MQEMRELMEAAQASVDHSKKERSKRERIDTAAEKLKTDLDPDGHNNRHTRRRIAAEQRRLHR